MFFCAWVHPGHEHNVNSHKSPVPTFGKYKYLNVVFLRGKRSINGSNFPTHARTKNAKPSIIFSTNARFGAVKIVLYFKTIQKIVASIFLCLGSTPIKLPRRGTNVLSRCKPGIWLCTAAEKKNKRTHCAQVKNGWKHTMV